MKQEQNSLIEFNSQNSNLINRKDIKIHWNVRQINEKHKRKTLSQQFSKLDIKSMNSSEKINNQQKILSSKANQTCITNQNKTYSPAIRHTGFNMKFINPQHNSSDKNVKSKKYKKVGSKIYDKIQQINLKQQRITSSTLHNISQRLSASSKLKHYGQNQDIGQKQVFSQSLPQPFINKKQLVSFQQIAVHTDYFKSRAASLQRQKYNHLIQTQLRSLQINSIQSRPQSYVHVLIQDLTKNLSPNYQAILQSSIIRKNRYKKKKLEPLKITGIREKMSNNIKDYLSVEKIQIKEIQEQLITQAENLNHRLVERNTERAYNFDIGLYRDKNTTKDRKGSITLPVNKQNIKKRNIKFVIPFPLYYYRDFIWKVGFSNNIIVETVPQYQTKVKIYLGKGNNSNLIKGLIRRRPWYQITQKYQQAHFVWTQIKIQAYFSLQKNSTNKNEPYQELDSPLINEDKNIPQIEVFNGLQKVKYSKYWQKNIEKQMKFKDTLKNRSKALNIKQKSLQQILSTTKIHNHLKNNYVIGNKKALFSLMSQFYSSQKKQVFQFLPLTFHIKQGLSDDQYLKFLQHYYALSKQLKRPQSHSHIYKHNAWIVKPGQNSNRGNGIIVCLSLNEIKEILKKKQKHNDGTNKTYILQKYIERPLLYKRRKFDLRHYVMMNQTNGVMKGYWYREGYVRTTSTQYTLKFSSGSVHLTNDAVQKQLPDYGKYEKGNKISYDELNEYIKKNDKNFDFYQIVYPKMKKIATDTMRASAKLMDPQKKQQNFQVFGLDFMIDQAYNVWLIQVNSNPCLQLSCPLLSKIIPKMVQNTLRVCLDPIFPPPLNFISRCPQYYQNVNQLNCYQLVYDQRMDREVKEETGLLGKQFEEDDDTFDDDGEDFD